MKPIILMTHLYGDNDMEVGKIEKVSANKYLLSYNTGEKMEFKSRIDATRYHIMQHSFHYCA